MKSVDGCVRYLLRAIDPFSVVFSVSIDQLMINSQIGGGGSISVKWLQLSLVESNVADIHDKIISLDVKSLRYDDWI